MKGISVGLVVAISIW